MFNSLCRHFYLLYLLLNICNGNDVKHVLLGRLLVALKRATVSGSEKSRLCSVLAL